MLGCFATQAQVNVTATAGTLTGSYVNLTNAFAAINTGVHQGSISIDITASITEGTGIASLNGSGVGPALYDSVVIRPTAPGIVDTGESAAVIQLKGADNVKIYGDYAADLTTTRDLTFYNASLGGSSTVIWITSNGTDGARNNVIQDCNIMGVDKDEVFYGILTGAHTNLGLPAASPALNNAIRGNSFQQTRDGIAIVGGFNIDDGWSITNNIFGSSDITTNLGYQAISIVNAQGIIIRGNDIAGIYGDVPQSVKGINLGQQISNADISNNKIHFLTNTDATVPAGACGIFVNTTNDNSGIVIYNNQVWGVGCEGNNTSWTADDNAWGIALVQGGNFQLYHNTVLMDADPESGDGHTAALYIGQGVELNAITGVKNNIFYTSTSVGTAYSVYNGAPAAFGVNAIDYNLYYSADADLSYLGAAVPDLASWKALTMQDTGSVSGSMVFQYDANYIYVDSSDANCWFIHGRSIALPSYAIDSRGLMRSTIVGIPSDIGDREFTPQTGVLPPDAIASAAPAPGTTTSYTSAGRKVAEIVWGTAGTVPADVYVKYYSGQAPPAIGVVPSIHSYWDITESGGAGYDYELSLTYTVAENNQQADGSLNIIRDSTQAGDWVNAAGTVSDINPDGRVCELSVVLTGFTTFSLGSVPLGLELLQFTARNNGGINQLNWKTADEKNMSHFEVLRSADGRNFSAIGKVNCKNEFMGSQYAFSDNTPNAGYNYYRLKMYEKNGLFTYSDIVAVKNAGAADMDITSVYPNPATSSLNVVLAAATQSTLSLVVTDLTGKSLLSQNTAVQAGANDISVNVSELPAGIYMIKATLADGTSSIQKFVKQ